jgi:hypothetical protein
VECEKKSGVVSDGSGVISEESGVINVEWSGFGGEWSAKCRVEWFRRGSINVEWSVIGEVGSCTAPYGPFDIVFVHRGRCRVGRVGHGPPKVLAGWATTHLASPIFGPTNVILLE